MKQSTLVSLTSVFLISSVGHAQTADEAIWNARGAAQQAADVEGALETVEDTAGAQAGAWGVEAAGTVSEAARAFEPVDFEQIPADWDAHGLDLSKARRVENKLVQEFEDGSRVTFTVDPDIQAYLEKMLDDYNVPHSGVVLMDPPTGRVLAMVSHTEHEPAIPDIARKSTAPSASVFKVVTAAALVETAGIDPEKPVCYHGGRSRLTARNIKGDPRRDHKCATLDAALAWSINSIMAKLAYNHLSKEDMYVWAERFGYNSEIPFELPVEISTAEFVDDPMERARSAAGFWHTYLSPLHGAMIGAALANDGVMMQPSIIERYETADGEVLQQFKPRVFRRVMSPKTARLLGEYMEKTTRQGTARRYFQRNGFPGDVVVSGKTGTLSNKDPYLGFTWFVGYGQHREHDARVAVSGLVCNTPIWRIKGPYAASEAVRKFFETLQERDELAHKGG